MFVVTARESENSPRRREFDNWYVEGIQANDPDIVIYRLCGQTTREADGSEPQEKYTTTSPIVACDGNMVTTASGSQYYLSDTPDVHQEIDCPTQYIASKFLNSWVDGQNWLTI